MTLTLFAIIIAYCFKLYSGSRLKKTPEEGCQPILHCLFTDLKGSGWFYSLDLKRAPLHFMRYPGEPEFTGY